VGFLLKVRDYRKFLLCIDIGCFLTGACVAVAAGNIAAISEVSDDQETTIFYAGVQAGSRLSGA